MTLLTSPSNFTVSLSLSAHAQAETARKQQRQPVQAKQAYLNALAVYATHFYLDCMAFDTEIATDDSTIQQTLLNSGALTVSGSDPIECRPVLPTETELFVPPDVQCDRLGYVAVQLSEDLRQAILLGFVESIESDYTPLSQLQPIESLTEKLSNLESQSVAAQASMSEPTGSEPTKLSNWINNIVEAGWQTVDSLLDDLSNLSQGQAQLAWGFRSAPEVSESSLTESSLADSSLTGPSLTERDDAIVQRCKQIQLKQDSKVQDIQNLDVILQVGFIPQNSDEVRVWVQLRPIEPQQLLPNSLQLLVLDQNNIEVMQAEARSTEAIQLKFIGTIGEQFSLKIKWNTTSFVESFVI